MSIAHMGTQYWEMVDSEASSFGKLAKLNSVWWMVIETIFRGVPPGRYKVQWRLGLATEAPVVNTDFRVVLFDQHKVTMIDRSDKEKLKTTWFFIWRALLRREQCKVYQCLTRILLSDITGRHHGA